MKDYIAFMIFVGTCALVALVGFVLTVGPVLVAIGLAHWIGWI